jgi:hypothetical protein
MDSYISDYHGNRSGPGVNTNGGGSYNTGGSANGLGPMNASM